MSYNFWNNCNCDRVKNCGLKKIVGFIIKRLIECRLSLNNFYFRDVFFILWYVNFY